MFVSWMLNCSTRSVSLYYAVQGAAACHECKNYRNGTVCVSECPVDAYVDERHSCQHCHDLCDKDFGCDGPTHVYGYKGCNRCVRLWVRQDERRVCLASNITDCRIGYYRTRNKVASRLLARDAQAKLALIVAHVSVHPSVCVSVRDSLSRACTQHCASRATSTTGLVLLFITLSACYLSYSVSPSVCLSRPGRYLFNPR